MMLLWVSHIFEPFMSLIQHLDASFKSSQRAVVEYLGHSLNLTTVRCHLEVGSAHTLGCMETAKDPPMMSGRIKSWLLVSMNTYSHINTELTTRADHYHSDHYHSDHYHSDHYHSVTTRIPRSTTIPCGIFAPLPFLVASSLALVQSRNHFLSY